MSIPTAPEVAPEVAESPSANGAGRPRVLSGIQPTADSFHFGNYLGALRQWVDLQEDYQPFFFIADMHAITVEHDPKLLRERSLRYLFPDISTQDHLEHTVRLVSSGRVSLRSTITHVLKGIESVPQAFEITAQKGKYQAINPAQVMMKS